MSLKIGLLAGIIVASMLSGCAVPTGGPVVTPLPSPGDVEGQIMSVTGAGFIICRVDHESEGGMDVYLVDVCGDVSRAKTTLAAKFPREDIEVHAYRPDDGGAHSPQSLVMQFWVDRTTGPGFTVTSSEILDNGMIDVGVDGDQTTAEAVLDKEFPGWIKVHHQDQVKEL
jgi:hypothetical protein